MSRGTCDCWLITLYLIPEPHRLPIAFVTTSTNRLLKFYIETRSVFRRLQVKRRRLFFVLPAHNTSWINDNIPVQLTFHDLWWPSIDPMGGFSHAMLLSDDSISNRSMITIFPECTTLSTNGVLVIYQDARLEASGTESIIHKYKR